MYKNKITKINSKLFYSLFISNNNIYLLHKVGKNTFYSQIAGYLPTDFTKHLVSGQIDTSCISSCDLYKNLNTLDVYIVK